MAEHVDTRAVAGKYLTFVLAEEEYGLAVLKVREIIRMMDLTAVPQMPPHVRGVINLRGKMIPVVDLRLRFGLSGQDATEHTCIVVVQVGQEARRLILGVIVDRVCEVLNIGADEIEAPPDFGGHLDTQFRRGIANIKSRVTVLLDLDSVLAGDASPSKAA